MRDGARFALESREPIGIGSEQVGQDFDRDVALELRVPRGVDRAHAPGAAELGYQVWTEECPWSEGHRSAISYQLTAIS